MVAPLAQQLIPRIWADTLLRRMLEDQECWRRLHEAEQAAHEERMQDPAYAKAYALRQAEDDAESYWTALYENWFPPEEDEDEW